MSFFKSLVTNDFRPVRRFVFVSYDELNVETFDAELSGVTSAHSVSILDLFPHHLYLSNSSFIALSALQKLLLPFLE